MEAKLLVCVQDCQPEFVELAERHEDADSEAMIADIRENYPHLLMEEPVVEEMQGEPMWESSRYILTGEEHNMGETMRIYEKV